MKNVFIVVCVDLHHHNVISDPWMFYLCGTQFEDHSSRFPGSILDIQFWSFRILTLNTDC